MNNALAIQEQPVQKKFNSNVIELYPNKDHEFVMTTKQVANAYGVTEAALRSTRARHKDELVEGEHLFRVAKCNAKGRTYHVLYYTKRGVVTLGFFIKSERAKEFRKWAANLILDHMEKKQKPEPKRKALGRPLQLPLSKPDNTIILDTQPLTFEDRHKKIYLTKSRLWAVLKAVDFVILCNARDIKKAPDNLIIESISKDEVMRIISEYIDKARFPENTETIARYDRQGKGY